MVKNNHLPFWKTIFASTTPVTWAGIKRDIYIFFQKLLVPAALTVFILLILDAANPLINIPTRDSGSYLYTARLILRGGLPYINAWDSKPPAIFYINALGLWLGHGTRWGVWFLEFIFLFSSALIGYELLKKIWQPGAAIFGTVIWLWGLNLVFWHGNLIEEYPLLFNITALLLFWRGNQTPQKWICDFALGVMASLSFLFRANNISIEVSIALTWVILGVLQRQYLPTGKRLLSMISGVTLSLLCAAVFLWKQGILKDAWDASILYNYSYIGNHSSISSSIIPGFQYLGPVAWISLIGFIFALVNVYLKIKSKTLDGFTLLLVILWPVEILFSSLSGRGYRHYFVNWLPPIMLLCGCLYNSGAPIIFSNTLKRFLNKGGLPIILIALFSISINIGKVINYYQTIPTLLFHREHGVEDINDVSSYVYNHTTSEDKVLDWVQSGINYMSRRDSPTPYLWYPEYLPSAITSVLTEGFIQDIKNNPPELIVDAYSVAPDDILSLDPEIRKLQIDVGKGLVNGRADNLDQFLKFFQDNYQLENVIDDNFIYRLKK